VVTGQHCVDVDLTASASYTVGAEYAIELSAGTVDGVSVVGKVVGIFSIANRTVTRVTLVDTVTTVTGGALETSLQALITTVGAAGAGLTATATAVWAVATRLLTAGTNIVLAKGTGVTGFNDLSAAQVNTEADTALSDVGMTTTRTGYLDNLSAGAVALQSSLSALITTVGVAGAGLTATATAVWAAGTRTLSSFGTLVADTITAIGVAFGVGSYLRNTEPLDAAGVRTAVGLGSANLDTQLDALPTNAELATALAAADDATLLAIANLSIPTVSAIAAGILAAAGVAPIAADVKKINATTVDGVGSSGDPWGPA
jgi:hypothetical protein